jgi:hypothetical protein
VLLSTEETNVNPVCIKTHHMRTRSATTKIKIKRKGWILTKRKKKERNDASVSLPVDQLKVFHYINMIK